MARKKRAKKAKKVAKRKPVARKKVAKKAKKVAKKAKKVTRRTKAAAKKIAKAVPMKAAVKPAAVPKPMIPPVPPNEERVGSVTHYYTHLGVAVVQLDPGALLRVGETIHIRGHTSDFTQRVDSMEIEHVHVAEARGGQSFGLKVREHAREHDAVYRVKPF